MMFVMLNISSTYFTRWCHQAYSVDFINKSTKFETKQNTVTEHIETTDRCMIQDASPPTKPSLSNKS